jgi:hypothetical protein
MNRHPLLESRRRFLRGAMGTGVFVTTGASTLLPALVRAMGKIPDELVPGKSIYDMRGKVWVDGERANEDTFINANALVETGSNSYVVFVIGTDAHILRENSRTQFEGEDDTIEDKLKLVTGKLLSVFGQREEREHQVETSTATIGIRGTGLYAETAADSSYICTCYGRTQIASRTDGNATEEITSVHHDAPRYVLRDPEKGKLIIPAPMKNHTDEELVLIEELVGRKPPFSSLDSYSAPRKGY